MLDDITTIKKQEWPVKDTLSKDGMGFVFHVTMTGDTTLKATVTAEELFTHSAFRKTILRRFGKVFCYAAAERGRSAKENWAILIDSVMGPASA